jgi:hypothetical protein
LFSALVKRECLSPRYGGVAAGVHSFSGITSRNSIPLVAGNFAVEQQ